MGRVAALAHLLENAIKYSAAEKPIYNKLQDTTDSQR